MVSEVIHEAESRCERKSIRRNNERPTWGQLIAAVVIIRISQRLPKVTHNSQRGDGMVNPIRVEGIRRGLVPGVDFSARGHLHNVTTLHIAASLFDLLIESYELSLTPIMIHAAIA